MKQFKDLEILYGAGRHQEAVTLAQVLLRANPNHAATHLIFGLSLATLGRSDLAITCFENALKINPSDQKALNGVALALIAQGRHRDAIGPLERALAIDSADIRANLYLGLARLHLGEYAAAIPPLSIVVEKEPESSKGWGNLGSAYMNVHRYEDAAACQQTALRLSPDRAGIANQLLFALNFADLNNLDSNLLLHAFKLHHAEFLARHPLLRPVIAKVVEFDDWRKANAPHAIEIDPERSVALLYGDALFVDEYLAEASWVAELKEVDVIAGWDYVIAPSGEVLDGSGYLRAYSSFPWVPHAYSRPAEKMIHLWSDEFTRIEDPILFLSNPQEFQIGHWIVDFLPRLRGWAEVRKVVPLRLAIPKSLPKRHREFLSLFGVADADLIEMELGQRYRFSALWVMCQGHRNDPHPEKIKFLHRSLARPSLGDAPPSARIYLDRGQSIRGRKIVNFDEFEATLREFHFTSIQLGSHSAARQVEILGKAAIVIGSLGTDLASMFHLPSGANLIMLVQKNMKESNVENDARAFERSAAILGIRSHRLICEPQRDEKAERAFWKRALYYRDIVVDCNALRKVLSEIL